MGRRRRRRVGRDADLAAGEFVDERVRERVVRGGRAEEADARVAPEHLAEPAVPLVLGATADAVDLGRCRARQHLLGGCRRERRVQLDRGLAVRAIGRQRRQAFHLLRHRAQRLRRGGAEHLELERAGLRERAGRGATGPHLFAQPQEIRDGMSFGRLHLRIVHVEQRQRFVRQPQDDRELARADDRRVLAAEQLEGDIGVAVPAEPAEGVRVLGHVLRERQRGLHGVAGAAAMLLAVGIRRRRHHRADDEQPAGALAGACTQMRADRVERARRAAAFGGLVAGDAADGGEGVFPEPRVDVLQVGTDRAGLLDGRAAFRIERRLLPDHQAREREQQREPPGDRQSTASVHDVVSPASCLRRCWGRRGRDSSGMTAGISPRPFAGEGPGERAGRGIDERPRRITRRCC